MAYASWMAYLLFFTNTLSRRVVTPFYCYASEFLNSVLKLVNYVFCICSKSKRWLTFTHVHYFRLSGVDSCFTEFLLHDSYTSFYYFYFSLG